MLPIKYHNLVSSLVFVFKNNLNQQKIVRLEKYGDYHFGFILLFYENHG